MPVTKRTRYEVLKRDNHTCRYCGAAAPEAKLTVDHVTPVALGGNDDPANLVAACRDCNAGKASSAPGAPLVADVAQDALRWARAIERAAAAMTLETSERLKLNGEIFDLWNEHCRTYDNYWWRPDDWPETLDMFRTRGLPQDEILDAFWIMLGKSHVAKPERWRYFCGILWRKLEQLQNAAKSFLEVED